MNRTIANSKCVDAVASALLGLVTKHGDTARVMDDIAARNRERVKISEDALYHLKKICGIRREEQKHIDELKKMGIVLDDTVNYTVVKSGIEKFNIALDDGNGFALCGNYFFQNKREI